MPRSARVLVCFLAVIALSSLLLIFSQSGRARAGAYLPVQAQAVTAVSAFLTPTLNIEGQGYTSVNPPDPVVDVGPDHVIQMVNAGSGALFNIFDKSGNLLAGPTDLDNLVPNLGACNFGRGDPIVLYDQLAGRWLLSEVSSSGKHLCVYISATNDPLTTSWYAYDFATPDFPDYPKFAVWPDAYYVSTNESSPAVYALDRANMLQGNPATFQRFTAVPLAGFVFQALLPSDQDGILPPPAGAPNYFMRQRDDEVHNPGENQVNQDFLEIWEFHVDFSAPGNSTFQHTQDIPIAEIDSDLCGIISFTCFPQPGSSVRLDPLREVVMWRLQYRNFGSHETLVANLVTDVDGDDQGGIRWFELRRSGSGDWFLYQEGTLAPDEHNRWLGSAALDGLGNLALGYSVVSESLYPSIRYAGRLENDPLGTLPYQEGSIAEGTAANGSNRWGDYSALTVDPVDDCTFWFTHMYNESSKWKTRIATFHFPECMPEGFRLTAVPNSKSICVPGTAVFDLHLTYQPGFNNPVTITSNNPPGATTIIPPTPVVSPTVGTTLTLTLATTPPGNYDLGITGTGVPTPTQAITVPLHTFDALPGPVSLTEPSDGEVDISTWPSFSWNNATQSELYTIEIAADASFNNIIHSTTVPTTTYTLNSPLAGFTTYYWRVTSRNACGSGLTSKPSQFTTGSTLYLKTYFPVFINN